MSRHRSYPVSDLLQQRTLKPGHPRAVDVNQSRREAAAGGYLTRLDERQREDRIQELLSLVELPADIAGGFRCSSAAGNAAGLYRAR